MIESRFLRFCAVGTLGFVVDSGTLVGLRAITAIGPITGRLVSFLVAATVTWHCNRRYTFRHQVSASVRGWARYVVVTALGALINLGAYGAWLTIAGSSPLQLVIGVALGSILALGFNYTTSRLFVFR